MLPSRLPGPVPPPPDYARYRAVSIHEAIELGETPYQGRMTNRQVSTMRKYADRWIYLFEYCKFDEWGTAEVLTWCEERWGRSFCDDGKLTKHDKTARWWLMYDFYIMFADVEAATEFKLRWV